MAIAAALLVWEGRGLTLLIDDWQFGFAARTNFDASAFLSDHNGHFVAVPILLTKASLQLFGADAALPLRLLGVAVHLTAVACLFWLLRPALGAVGALAPAVLVLFLGAGNDVLIGSHGLPFTISVATGLAAWLALQQGRLGWDITAAVLLTAGVCSDGTALPFVVGAAAIVALAGGPRARYWVVAVPAIVYGLWWLKYGGESDFAIANLAGLPSFAFDSLAAALGSIAGVFTTPGGRTVGFDMSAGQALAGGFLAVVLVGLLARRLRPGAPIVPALLALLLFWVFTASVASPARQPFSSRYIYVSVVLLLLVLAWGIAATPVRQRGTLALSAICVFALLPNIRELTYGGDYAREQAEDNRVAMGVGDLLTGQAPNRTLLETDAERDRGDIPDAAFSLDAYEAAKQRFGTDSYSPAEIEAAEPRARGVADGILARALALEPHPAAAPPRGLPRPRLAHQTGGVLTQRDGCLLFAPLVAGAQVNLPVPRSGLWLRPGPGPAVEIGLKRFADEFDTPVGSVLGGRASVLGFPLGSASEGWRAQMAPEQQMLICAA